MRVLIFIGMMAFCFISGCVRPIDVVNGSLQCSTTASQIDPPKIEDSASQFSTLVDSSDQPTFKKTDADTSSRESVDTVAKPSVPTEQTPVTSVSLTKKTVPVSSQPKAKQPKAKQAKSQPVAQKSEYANVPFPVPQPLNRRVPMPRDNDEEKSPFQKLDINQDGKLSGTEIPETLANLIPEIDTNKDNALTQEELRAFSQR